jgi:aspartyl/asparaginyl beta-hydroxylase (cupin superfamily)
MRVGDKMIYWEEGKCVIFDDTHKHEVWNDTNGIRVVLLFDVFRPLPGWLTLVNKTRCSMWLIICLKSGGRCGYLWLL